MPEETPAAIASWVAETWAARLAESIETMTGARPEVSAQLSEDATPLEGALWWEQPLSLQPQAIVWVGSPEPAWNAIGKHTLASAGIESSEAGDIKNTFLEISSQALSGLSQALSKRVGRTVSCENGAENEGPGAESIAFDIGLAVGDSGPLVLRLCVSHGLLTALLEPQNDAPASASGAADSSETGMTLSDARRDVAPRQNKTIELLMDVELPVSVSFGRADLALKDVLKLTTGSIVELNRGLSEPVEVIVNNCVVARGEVVVIEGNYGVRIQEIISRDKRLRTLR